MAQCTGPRLGMLFWVPSPCGDTASLSWRVVILEQKAGYVVPGTVFWVQLSERVSVLPRALCLLPSRASGLSVLGGGQGS